MKKHLIAVILLLLILTAGAQQKTVVVEKVYTGSTAAGTMVIYHRLSEEAPYHVRVFNVDSSEPRQFYVIKFSTAVFEYLLVEKMPDHLLYYPLVWTELKAVSLNDVRERSEDILKGRVKPVPKSDL